YVYDLQTATTTLVSVSLSGTAGSKETIAPMISADGRYVLFDSYDTNLVANDPDGGGIDPPLGGGQLFLRDLQQDTTSLVSVNDMGTDGGNGTGYYFAGSAINYYEMSPDGSIVTFLSNASDLVPHDFNGEQDIFQRNVGAQTTTLVTAASVPDVTGTSGNSLSPSV